MPVKTRTTEPRTYFPLHKAQLAFADSQKTFRGYVGGRGSGKTIVGAYDLCRRAMARPGRYMLCSANFPMLEESSVPALLDVARQCGWLKDANARRVILKSGARISLRSAHQPESLRGPSLAGVWMDEASIVEYAAYKILIACLRDRGRMGWLSATFTPKGKLHWTYANVFGPHPKTGLLRKNAFLQHSTTRENPFLPPDFEEIIREEYEISPHLIAQELGGRFMDPEGAIFKAGWRRFYTRIGDYYRLGPDRVIHEKACLRFQTIDLAYSLKTTADYTVIATWDDTRQGELILVDVERRRMEPLQTVNAIINSNALWRPAFVVIEVNGCQTPIVRDCVQAGVIVRPITVHKDKLTRSIAAQVKMEQGRVWFPTPQLCAWYPEFEAELFSFTGDESEDEHDDQVDAFSCAVGVSSGLARKANAAKPLAANGMPQL